MSVLRRLVDDATLSLLRIPDFSSKRNSVKIKEAADVIGGGSTFFFLRIVEVLAGFEENFRLIEDQYHVIGMILFADGT